ncbi:phosphate ABC transporter substrate-binding protein [Glaciecola siphonariae]|uniref:Phosphate ABC transporter substrate-binding protein n=1 Tax=Glaciecola siphonariae TaxID=521012 RepID=A0ABV9LWK4_9ALTE
MIKHILSFASLLLFASIANAELTVIVNKANANQLDEKTIQRIFLGKEKKFADGSESIPVNQSPDSAMRQQFDESILGRSSSQVSAYWSKLVFTGKGIPPKEMMSDAEVIELVASNPSVIAYIESSSLTDAVKAVEL